MTLTQERPATMPEPVRKHEPTQDMPADVPQDEVLQPRRWTTAEYYALSDLGVFDDERVELLDGEIWKLPAQKTPHFAAIRRAVDALEITFGSDFDFRQQVAISLEDGTEPEPDVVAVPGPWQNYEDHHPTPSEVRLLVEVSDATLWKDRKKKQNTYARAGITDYWIVNLVNRQLEVHPDPAPMNGGYGYKTVQTLFDGDSIAPLSAPSGASIDVAKLFPPVKGAE